MKRLIGIIVFICMSISLLFGISSAEHIVYSERCLKIKQAELAIQEKYQIIPEMYTFFVREVAEDDHGTVIVTLRGQDNLYWVLGTYTGSSDGKAEWSNEGKQTYGGFEAPAWDALQLHQMIELTRKEHEVGSYYHQSVSIAMRDDPEYSELREPDPMLIYEHGFEMTVPHPDHETIETKSKFTREELNRIAVNVITETYGLDSDATEKVHEVDSEPDFRYEIKDGQLIYHAWLELQQSSEIDSKGFNVFTEHDGQYLVVIDAETGVVEDVVYDALLNGNG